MSVHRTHSRTSPAAAVALVAVLGLGAAVALACEWDYDTLQQEKARFPDTLELLTGQFPRHSDDFYRWRIEDRRARLESEPDNLELLDDIAVALDKLGRHDEAIATDRRALEMDPDRYRTHANLGTHLIHAGRLEEGLEHIDRAIEINPDAHFGREIVQRRLVAYVLAHRTDDGTLPLPLEPGSTVYGDGGFMTFVDAEEGRSPGERTADHVQANLKGVLGMLRFGNHQSPVLLEACADLLLADPNTDGKRLAARAYLKASYAVRESDPQAADAYREKAGRALIMQTPEPGRTRSLTLDELEEAFQRELARADEWIAGVHDDERRWIAAGADVEAEFAAKYWQSDSSGPDGDAPGTPAPRRLGMLALAVIGAAAAALVLVLRRRA